MSDEKPFDRLMEDLRRGDSDAAQAVFERFSRRLVGLAAARLPGFARPTTDPEDIAQSVLRTFFRRHGGGEFQPQNWDALWSLLAILTARKCGHRVGYLVAGKRDARREAPPPDPSSSSAPAWEPPDLTPSPEEAALLEETVGNILEGLKDRERPIVIMRLQGYEVAEIAAQIPCSERTVHRVLAAVREQLETLAAD